MCGHTSRDFRPRRCIPSRSRGESKRLSNCCRLCSPSGPKRSPRFRRHAPRHRRGLGRQDRDRTRPTRSSAWPARPASTPCSAPVPTRSSTFPQYYGAWVTPYAETVQERVRHAADLVPDRQIWGYQRDRDSVTQQVAPSISPSRKPESPTSTRSSITGLGPGELTQRTRLPRESLSGRAANCIDGSVLFASLLEGSSLNAALVLVPGHAFVGWEVWDGSDDWKFLETTMIGSHDFEAACISGERQYEQAKLFDQRPARHAPTWRPESTRDLAHGVNRESGESSSPHHRGPP